MNSEEIKKKMETLYRASVAKGIVKNKTEFAELTRLSRHTIYSALKGKPSYLNDRLYYRMEGAIRDAGVIVGDADSGDIINASSTDNHGTIIGKQEYQSKEKNEVIKLLDEMAEQRKIFTEQLRIKDEQIAKSMQLLKDFISSKS